MSLCERFDNRSEICFPERRALVVETNGKRHAAQPIRQAGNFQIAFFLYQIIKQRSKEMAGAVCNGNFCGVGSLWRWPPRSAGKLVECLGLKLLAFGHVPDLYERSSIGFGPQTLHSQTMNTEGRLQFRCGRRGSLGRPLLIRGLL